MKTQNKKNKTSFSETGQIQRKLRCRCCNTFFYCHSPYLSLKYSGSYQTRLLEWTLFPLLFVQCLADSNSDTWSACTNQYTITITTSNKNNLEAWMVFTFRKADVPLLLVNFVQGSYFNWTKLIHLQWRNTNCVLYSSYIRTKNHDDNLLSYDLTNFILCCFSRNLVIFIFSVKISAES